MIVYEHNESYVMVRQHDHALLSGQLASKLNSQYWPERTIQKEVLYAIQQHDRGWISLDEVPFWNDSSQLPYSFIDFPLTVKLDYYIKGIKEVAEFSHYAAYLCSKHYQSFFENATSKQGVEFYNNESARQKILLDKINIDNELIEFHFQLLQFFDDLSLYVCYQEPGVTKENELSWFRDGFSQSFHFLNNNERIIASWENEKKLRLTHPLITTNEYFSVQVKKVPKELVSEKGISYAFQSTKPTHRSFRISPPENEIK